MKIEIISIILFSMLFFGCAGTAETAKTSGTEQTSGSKKTVLGDNFKLFVSDAPADIGDFESLTVSFSKARIFEPGEGGFEEVELSGVSIDLTQLVNENITEIASLYLEPGKYTKIELHVNGTVGIVDGEMVLVNVPSNKLHIIKPFDVGNVTEFVFDINVVRKGNKREYNLLPVVGKSGVIGKDIKEKEVNRVKNRVRECNGHKFGERWNAEDGCNTCKCTGSGTACTEKACLNNANNNTNGNGPMNNNTGGKNS